MELSDRLEEAKEVFRRALRKAVVQARVAQNDLKQAANELKKPLTKDEIREKEEGL